jgi:uncharacterized protein (DUF2267 family)
MTAAYKLIQILLPTNADNKGLFEKLTQELTSKFGGVTSFIRAPAEGRWKTGSHTEHDEIAVIEVMTEEIDYGFWTDLRNRLEQALSQEHIVIRCQPMELL